jgi:ketosteroid isomerase-like protein
VRVLLEGIAVNSRRDLLASLFSSWPFLGMFRGEKGDESPWSSTETVEQALARFVAAFEDLDWERFRKCFSENATIFHPAPPNIKRIDSPEQFDKAWLGVFDRIKKNSGRTSPPYMKLDPTDVRVERLSDNVTLVTFHFVAGGTTSRRTLVFQRLSGAWKIVHIHASNLSPT